VKFLSEHLAIAKLDSSPNVRGLLAHLHSGEVLKYSLPKLLRISMAVWLVWYAFSWFLQWPTVYREFERWGLVKAFFAQMIAIATAALVTRITMLRAGHLEALPTDDFVVLRAAGVLCRWFGEVALVFVVGMWLSSFLQPVSPLLLSILGTSSEGSGATLLKLVLGAVSALAILFVGPLFLFAYSVATAIDVSLAIEFNTRSERAGQEEALRFLEPGRRASF